MMLFRYSCVLTIVVACLAVNAPLAAATLPPGFSETLVASGMPDPTAIAIAPDGRIFVCQQAGQLRVIRDGVLLSTPFVTLSVSSVGERGLLGVAFDPDFATSQYVYVYYTTAAAPIHNRVSRFTANGDVALPASEFVLLDLDPLSGATNHNGGALHFGIDGNLYVAVGENANSSNSQTLGNLLGKMLRIKPDGTIPEDNPFYEVAVGKNRAIWALGLRNPFTFDVQPGSGRLFINDVGESTWEEINDGFAGANYGWPQCEGPCSPPRTFVDPVYSYQHDGATCAIVGAAFYNPTFTRFPPDYIGDYFFADLCAGWIRRIDPTDGTVVEFAAGITLPVGLAVGADGALYYLARGSGSDGVLYRVQFAADVFTAIDVAVDAIGRTRVLRTDTEGRASLSTFGPSGEQENSVSVGPYAGWTARAIGVAPDGRTRLLWTHIDGQVALWFVSASGVGETAFYAGPFSGWTAVDVSVGSDDRTRLLWTNVNGAASVYMLTPDGTYESQAYFGPFGGLSARRLDTGADNRTRLWWSNNATGTTELWSLDASGVPETAAGFGPISGWTLGDVGVGADNKARLLWHHSSGQISVWVVPAAGDPEGSIVDGPFPGWTARALDVGTDDRTRLLWSSTNGWTSVWVLSPSGAFETQFYFGPN